MHHEIHISYLYLHFTSFICALSEFAVVLVAPLIRVIKGSLSGACIRLVEKQSCVAFDFDGVQVDQFLSLMSFKGNVISLVRYSCQQLREEFFLRHYSM